MWLKQKALGHKPSNCHILFSIVLLWLGMVKNSSQKVISV